MRDAFRKHGKWLFIPTPVFIFAGAVMLLEPLVWVGLALLSLLIVILVTQRVLGLELIS